MVNYLDRYPITFFTQGPKFAFWSLRKYFIVPLLSLVIDMLMWIRCVVNFVIVNIWCMAINFYYLGSIICMRTTNYMLTIGSQVLRYMSSMGLIRCWALRCVANRCKAIRCWAMAVAEPRLLWLQGRDWTMSLLYIALQMQLLRSCLRDITCCSDLRVVI